MIINSILIISFIAIIVILFTKESKEVEEIRKAKEKTDYIDVVDKFQAEQKTINQLELKKRRELDRLDEFVIRGGVGNREIMTFENFKPINSNRSGASNYRANQSARRSINRKVNSNNRRASSHTYTDHSYIHNNTYNDASGGSSHSHNHNHCDTTTDSGIGGCD